MAERIEEGLERMNTEPGEPDLSADGWQQRYENEQTGWDRGEPNPALLHWLESGALTSGRVLVPGCGRGHEVVELARRDFEVTAIDFARTATQILTQRLLGQGLVADVLRESVLHFAAETPFDAIYEQTCLCALAPKHWPAYERRLHASLKPGGTLFALWMQSSTTGGPPFHCGLDAMKDLFAEDHWRWAEERFSVDHPSGMTEIGSVLTKA
ncbi:MAG: methyltransferase domain-containing protein [Planctomycetota bacterium]